MSIFGNVVGGGSGFGKTVILEDENGNQIVGVVTDTVQIFDATPDDVKIGKKFVSDNGIGEGTDTKTYRVEFATYLVFPGENFSIPLEKYSQYDYTKFQAMIAIFNTNILDSVTAIKTVIYDLVYDIGSNKQEAYVTKNTETKSVDFNMINNTDNIFIIHYNTYREE